MNQRRTLINVIVFTLAMVLVAAGLVVVFGQFRFASSNQFSATFSEASRLKSGQDVRIAGVPVGSVGSVTLNPDNTVNVAFDVDKRYQLYTSTRLVVRYENLVGDRYMEITSGPGELKKLPAGATISKDNTQPALDLDALLGGLKPVLKGLDGAKVNEISNAVIELLQGQGGALSNMLASTGSFTQDLASRDQLIGDVITNLNAVLTTVGDRDVELSNLIVEFRNFISGLTKDKDAILNSLDSISDLTQQTADITTGIRPGLVESVKNLRTVATNLNKGRSEVDRALQILPIKLEKIGRTAIYGSFFNFFLCEFKAKVILPTGPLAIPYQTYPGGNGRCNLK